MKKIISVTFFSGLLTLTRMMSGFIIAKIIALYTGPSGLALLSQLQNISNILNGFATSSVGQGIVKYTAEKKNGGLETCSSWWKAGLMISFISLLISSPLILLFSRQISEFLLGDEDYYLFILLIIASTPLAIIGTLLLSILNGLEEYKKYIVASIISVIFSCLLMIILVYSYGVIGALISASIQNGLLGLITIICVFRQKWFRLNFFWGYVNKEQLKGISGYALMAIVSAISIPITQLAIRYIMVHKVGWDITGQWQAVWKISEVYLSVITLSLSTYFLPKLSSLKNMREIQKEISSAFLIIFPLVVVMAFGIYFLRDFIILVLFTSNFNTSREYFSIQLLGDVIKIISWLYAYPMISRGMVKLYISTEIIFSLVFVFLSYVLINKYEAHGANYAYLITYVMYFITMYIFMARITKRESYENFVSR